MRGSTVYKGKKSGNHQLCFLQHASNQVALKEQSLLIYKPITRSHIPGKNKLVFDLLAKNKKFEDPPYNKLA